MRERGPVGLIVEGRGTVKGTVSVEGKPLQAGTITFDPSNINRKDVSARTVDVTGGNYSVTTLTGENLVSVHSPEVDRDPILSTNQRVVDVQAGESTVAIELP